MSKFIYITFAFDENDVSGGGLPIMAYRSSKAAYAAVERSKKAAADREAAIKRATEGLVQPDPTDLADYELEYDDAHPYQGGHCWYRAKEAAEWCAAISRWHSTEEAKDLLRKYTREDGVFDVEIAD